MPKWSRNGTLISGATAATYTALAADESDTITCTVTATDLGGSTAVPSAGVLIPLLAPSETSLPTITGTSTVNSVLTCAPGTWTGGPAYAYAWNRDGTAIPGAAAPTYAVQLADEGDTLTCTVTATNAVGTASATTAGVNVPLLAPTNTALPTITGSPAVGSPLVCNPGSWIGSTAYAYKWNRNGTAIAGATVATYTAQTADETDVITCTVTATNTAGALSKTSSGVTIAALPPTNTVLPKITGTPKVGSLLTCVAGTWTGGPTFTYAFNRNGTAISGATASTYTAQAADETSSITCTVTASNSAGALSETSLGVTVPLLPPTNTALPTISGTLRVGSLLTCSTGTWMANPTYTFRWNRNGIAIAGTTAATYAAEAADAGAKLTCTVTGTNAAGALAATSPPVTVPVPAPTNTTLPTITGTPKVGAVLTCNPGGWTGSRTETYTWSRNGSVIIGATSATYTLQAADAGDTITCTAKATNAGGSASATSTGMTVPAPPRDTQPPTLSGTPRVGATIGCSTGSWTGKPTYAYSWSRHGTVIAGATSSSYKVPSADAGDTITCTVTAKNAAGSLAATSKAIRVAGAHTSGKSVVRRKKKSASRTGSSKRRSTGSRTRDGTSKHSAKTGSGSSHGSSRQKSSSHSKSSGKKSSGKKSSGKKSSGKKSSGKKSSGKKSSGKRSSGRGASGKKSAAAGTRHSRAGHATGRAPSGQTKGSAVGKAPTNMKAPAVAGPPRSDAVLRCKRGAWRGSVGYRYRWTRDGVPIAGATAPTYVVKTSDEGSAIRCAVTASSHTGARRTTSSAPVVVPVPTVIGCPAATGRIEGATIGLVTLGMTQAQARAAYIDSSDHGRPYEDFFCLTPIGIRVGYASPKLLSTLPTAQASSYAGHVIWISTANPRYAVDGIRSGATLANAAAIFTLSPKFVVGLNDWYLAAFGTTTAVFKVRNGIVDEVGIADAALTRTPAQKLAFLTSFW